MAEVDVEEFAVARDHNVVVVPVANTEHVGRDTVARSRQYEVLNSRVYPQRRVSESAWESDFRRCSSVVVPVGRNFLCLRGSLFLFKWRAV